MINMKIPIEVSARHCHLSKKDLENLFGRGHKLKKINQLSFSPDFASEETIDIRIGLKEIKGIRVVGPERDKTQVEISLTDAINLKINPPIRMSGDLKKSESVTLEGPKGTVGLPEGLIISQRHIHCATDEAEKLGLKNGDAVSVKVDGERSVVFNNVIIRAKDGYKLGMHIDTDEGNAAGINQKGEGVLTV